MSMIAILMALLFAGEGKRTYWPVTIPVLAANDPAHWKGVRTHVQVEGWVAYVKKEDDGDMHIRLCDSASVKGTDRARCVVAECVPLLPCKAPGIGDKVRVKGIYRFDAESGHRWAEVHPVELLEVIP